MLDLQITPSRLQKASIGVAWVVLMAVIVMLLLLTGCRSTGTTTVTLDDAEPSVQHALPDTFTTAPSPLPLADTPTQPLEVRRFTEPDTTSPARLFTSLEFDRRSDRVRVRLDDRTYTYRAPARGEALSIRPDTAGQLQAGLSGTPTPRTVRVETEDSSRSVVSLLKWALWAVVLVLVLVFLNRVVR